MFRWLTRDASPAQRRALFAASSGWLLDAMDMMLYSMVLVELMKDFRMDAATAGLLNSVTLVASAAGGVFFGHLADRIGRVRALVASILLYTLFTCLSAAARDPVQLAVIRTGLGLGTGGEWAVGAALVAESWTARDRGKAMGLMQSAWAVGYACAAAIAALVLPWLGWRAVFLCGALPALVTIWIRRGVEEPALWVRRESGPGLSALFGDHAIRRDFIAVTAMNSAAMFAWWGLFTWIPAYLAMPVMLGGAGLGIVKSAGWVALMQVGTWLGYVSFGYFSDRFGRRRSYQVFVAAAAVLVFVYAQVRTPLALLLLGPLVGYFGTGYFSAIGTMTAELFPTAIRATAQGLSYNLGRLASAAAPFAVGALAESRGMSSSFGLVSAGFALAAVLAFFVPETLGRELA